MKKIFATSAALLASTTLATAGGLDRSGQGVGAIFESGNYAEVSLGHVSPSVEGTKLIGTVSSGNVAPSYTTFGGAIKMDLNDKLSFGVILDQPYGADVSYANSPATYAPFGALNTSAEVNSTAITALVRYKFNDSVSVHGGLKYTTADATLRGIPGGPGFYDANFNSDGGVGYVAGVAYERPEIAMRVALTYSSETDFDFDTDYGYNGAPLALNGTTSVTMPQSVNLDFQTGVAANTLIFGSVRWADYKVTSITPAGFGTILSYDKNPMTYSMGVGHRFSDTWSVATTVGYEAKQDGTASDLAPSNGNTSIGIGATYTMDNMKITAGVRYVQVGAATTNSGAAFFPDNSAVGVGVKVGFNF